MHYYEIAGIVFEIDSNDEFIIRRMKAYETDKREVDVTVRVTQSVAISRPTGLKIVRKGAFRTYARGSDGSYVTFDELRDGRLSALIIMNEDITRADLTCYDIEPLGGASSSVRSFNMIAEVFRFVVLSRNGVVFHSSSLSLNGEAILFSAPSGTGKSTHTSLWCRYVEGAEIFNDDSPALMIEGGKVFAYGTPWSGKTEINSNVRLPVKAIVFLERGEPNIRETAGAEQFLRLASQSFTVPFTSFALRYFDVAETVYNQVKTYILTCDISKRSVETAYNAIMEEKL